MESKVIMSAADMLKSNYQTWREMQPDMDDYVAFDSPEYESVKKFMVDSMEQYARYYAANQAVGEDVEAMIMKEFPIDYDNDPEENEFLHNWNLKNDKLQITARKYYALGLAKGKGEAVKFDTVETKPESDAEPITCKAHRDGDCYHKRCPQLKDGEPKKSGRHCPLDTDNEED